MFVLLFVGVCACRCRDLSGRGQGERADGDYAFVLVCFSGDCADDFALHQPYDFVRVLDLSDYLGD